MNEMPSSEFRKQYAKLTEPTPVTVNGHVIGYWVPKPWWNAEVEIQATLNAKYPQGVPVKSQPSRTTQAQRDDLLRKINRGK